MFAHPFLPLPYPTLGVAIWHEETHCDELTNKLMWSLLNADLQKSVKYEFLLLRRYGYVFATLVGHPAMLDSHQMRKDSTG